MYASWVLAGVSGFQKTNHDPAGVLRKLDLFSDCRLTHVIPDPCVKRHLITKYCTMLVKDPRRSLGCAKHD